MKLNIPVQAGLVIEILQAHGFEAYVVGGCVRDSILGKKPMDWDITTSAAPMEVKALFKRTVDTGIQHGTVTVLMDKEAYEVTTYRVDGEYEDHRRPKEVTFTASLEEDLKRRDFTINAMAYNETEGLIDLFQGEQDLKQGIIRCVGEAADRFDEDALRILRAIRFAAQLDFQIETQTKAAIQSKYPFLSEISAERIQVELTKLLTSDHPQKLLFAAQMGITSVILPEFDCMLATRQENPHHCYNVGKHSVEAAACIEADPILRWTMLLHDVAKPIRKYTDEWGIAHFEGHAEEGAKRAEAILKRLKMDNHTIRTVVKLITWHDYRWSVSTEAVDVRRLASRIGPELFPELLKIQKADVCAQSDYYREEKQQLLNRVEQFYQGILERKECLTLREMNMDGRQLMDLGIQPGVHMGTILDQLLELVIDNPPLNTTEQLRQVVRERFL